MEKAARTTERNSEIVTFFYLIFGHRIHHGVDQVTAKKEACDAVSLRYGISKGRLLNIISEQNNSQFVNRSAFREKALDLIEELTKANEQVEEVRKRNETLISLLKDSLEHDGR